MNQELRSKLLCLFLLLVFGCPGCAPSTATPTFTLVTEPTMIPIHIPSPTPSSGTMIHDPKTRTGVEDIDYIIDVVLEGNVDKVRDIVVFTVTRCTREDGLGGPPKCREGENEDMQVEVLPFLGPEGHFLRRDEIHEWPGIEVAGLYAVYRVSEDAYSEEYYPVGQFAVIFIGAGNGPSVSLRVDNGGVVRIDYIFGKSPETKLELETEEIILPPPSH